MKETWDFDRDPLAALRRGDPEPFEAFVALETPTFLAFFLRLGASRAEAEDMVQELFLKLFRHAPAYQAQDRFAAFAFRVARNAWIDRARRGRDLAPLGPPGEASPLEAVASAREDEPAALAARGEEAQRLHAALAELGELHRTVFELGVLQALPYAEIAAALAIPVGTVKSRVFYALRKLRVALDGPEEGAHAAPAARRKQA